MNLTKNSSSGNIFKKPCINKNSIKTFFIIDKKRDNFKNNKSDVNLSQEYILGDDSPQKKTLVKVKNKCFSNTSFCWGKTNRISKSKNRVIKVH